MKKMYRGYSIFYHSADGWHAFAYRPRETEAYGKTVRASVAEGAGVLLKRAQAGIDADLDKKTRTRRRADRQPDRKRNPAHDTGFLLRADEVIE